MWLNGQRQGALLRGVQGLFGESNLLLAVRRGALLWRESTTEELFVAYVRKRDGSYRYRQTTWAAGEKDFDIYDEGGYVGSECKEQQNEKLIKQRTATETPMF